MDGEILSYSTHNHNRDDKVLEELILKLHETDMEHRKAVLERQNQEKNRRGSLASEDQNLGVTSISYKDDIKNSRLMIPEQNHERARKIQTRPIELQDPAISSTSEGSEKIQEIFTSGEMKQVNEVSSLEGLIQVKEESEEISFSTIDAESAPLAEESCVGVTCVQVTKLVSDIDPVQAIKQAIADVRRDSESPHLDAPIASTSTATDGDTKDNDIEIEVIELPGK